MEVAAAEPGKMAASPMATIPVAVVAVARHLAMSLSLLSPAMPTQSPSALAAMVEQRREMEAKVPLQRLPISQRFTVDRAA